MKTPASIVVLISGSGSNLQALIDAEQKDELSGKITAVISNKPDAFGLERARKAGIETQVIDHRNFDDRESYDEALAEAIDQYQPDLVVLAGFMRILTADFVNHYSGRMLNIHPSLLPKYRGLNTHQRAIDDGETHHGVSVHFVTPELDGGPIIVQSSVELHENDDKEILAERVQTQEHLIYPLAVKWFCQNRISLINNHFYFDNELRDKPFIFQNNTIS
ncbi:MAG: phosphoribosylglycinamide formyltransferase [Gammaproteobacteria bacterium]|nr:phosphoribosylglycinamide formyltransferase [Gammaproteobacteria bacterium]